MHKICEICGAELQANATFCRRCKRSDSLTSVEGPAIKVGARSTMTTAMVLIAMASIWIVGLGYVFGEVRPRSWGAVALTWGGLTAVTTAVSFSLRNTKMAAIFSGIGLAFCAAYGFLRI